MKKFFLIVAAITFIGILSITSCGKRNKWIEKDKKEFLGVCISEASVNPGIVAESYCNCMLEKIMAKYPDPKDVDKISMAEVTQWAQDCLER